jgi:putative hydrolase of the HAD superfamily
MRAALAKDVMAKSEAPLTIFLDLDGTLLDHDAAERTAAVRFLRTYRGLFPNGSRVEFANRWQAIAEKHLTDYLAGRLTFTGQRRARMRELFGSAGVSLTDDDADEVFGTYLRHYERSWRPFPDAAPCLDRLGGYRLGIISNGDRDQQYRKLESIGLRERFAYVLTSEEAGVAKPAAEIFHEACRRAGCAPEGSIYVGDRLETDAQGAQAAGLHGIWLDRSGSGRQAGEIASISSLDELPAHVEEVRCANARVASRPDHAPGPDSPWRST